MQIGFINWNKNWLPESFDAIIFETGKNAKLTAISKNIF